MKEFRGKIVASSIDEVLDARYTALIVVDVQNDYCHAEGALGRRGWDISMCKGVIESIRSLLEAARASGVFVVFLQQTQLAGGLADSPSWAYRKALVNKTEEYTLSGTWGHRIVDELVPADGEVVIEKHRPDGFAGTKLDLMLRSNAITSVAVTGVVTEGCVESTARSAAFHDYYTVYVGDCMGSTSRDIHDAQLEIARFRGFDVVASGEVAAIWRRNPCSGPRFA